VKNHIEKLPSQRVRTRWRWKKNEKAATRSERNCSIPTLGFVNINFFEEDDEYCAARRGRFGQNKNENAFKFVVAGRALTHIRNISSHGLIIIL
jgi:hypothetical protein